MNKFPGPLVYQLMLVLFCTQIFGCETDNPELEYDENLAWEGLGLVSQSEFNKNIDH